MKDLTKVFNCDCLPAMREFPDKWFELAIVDPPYGIDRANNGKTIGKNKSRENSYIRRTDYNNKTWDSSAPGSEYFTELLRVSKCQIIWGGNYFTSFLPPVNSWIIWNKVNTIPTYSDGEMAWTSLKINMTIVPLKHSGFRRGQNIGEDSKVIYNEPFSGPMDIHPTQKPVALYKWLLKNYAKEGDKILDSHAGSQSSRIAAFDMGFEYVGYEIDKDYFEAGNKRFNQHKAQLKLFEV